MSILIAAVFALLGSGNTTAHQTSPDRYALLIGINKYSRPVAKISPKSWRHHDIPDLDGCENDVEAMASVLVSIYGWPNDEGHIKRLKGSDATRTGIQAQFAAIAKKAKANDTVFIFYSGHGSTVKNSATKKITADLGDGAGPDGVSNTIVPADSLDGAPDITDKELASAFNDVLDKGAKLTAVFDSCFSGSIGRGTVTFRKSKAVVSPNVEVPDLDVKQKDPDKIPFKRGALIVSAARYFEPASEFPPYQPSSETPRGAFAYALTETLLQNHGEASFEQTFAEARARLKAMNYPQEPAFEGPDERLSQGLFGEPVTAGKGLRLFVTQHPGATTEGVKFQGGSEIGLHKGAVVQASLDGKTALAVVDSDEVGRSIAKFKSGDATAYEKAVNFSVSDWASSTYPGLRLYVPRSSLASGDLAKDFSVIQTSLGNGRSVADPTITAPSAEVTGEGSQWILAKSTPTGPSVRTITDLTKIGQQLSAVDKVFTSLPLAADVAPDMKFGKADDDMVLEVDSLAAGPDYVLTGTVVDGKLKYAWVAPGAGAIDVKASANSTEKSLATQPALMPTETTWWDASDANLSAELSADAQRLSSLKNWSLLISHDDKSFPYHLELTDSNGKQVGSGGSVAGYLKATQAAPNQTYKLLLVQNPNAKIERTQNRYYYVMEVDSSWTGTLLFPGTGENNLVTPKQGDAPREVPDGGFRFTEPFGTEQFVLVTSVTPLPGSLFEFKGFATTRGLKDTDPLAQLLRQAGAGKRDAERIVVPSTWSIQRLVVTSAKSSSTYH